jgi:hypothetical protein
MNRYDIVQGLEPPPEKEAAFEVRTPSEVKAIKAVVVDSTSLDSTYLQNQLRQWADNPEVGFITIPSNADAYPNHLTDSTANFAALDVQGNAAISGTVSAANPIGDTNLTTKKYVDNLVGQALKSLDNLFWRFLIRFTGASIFALLVIWLFLWTVTK